MTSDVGGKRGEWRTWCCVGLGLVTQMGGVRELVTASGRGDRWLTGRGS